MRRLQWTVPLVIVAFAATMISACAFTVDELREAGDVEGLIELLALSDDGEVRAEAAQALGDLGDDAATTPLIGRLDDDEPTVRAAAADALGGLADLAALEPLLAASFDPDETVGDRTLAAIDELLWSVSEDAAVDALVSALDADDALVREAAEEDLELFLTALDPLTAAEAIVAADAGDDWLAVALDIDESELSTETWLLGLQLEPMDDIRHAVADVEDDDETAVTDAHPYEESDAFHPAVVVGGVSPWADSDAWAPTALRYLELVILVDDVEWELQENCGTYYDVANQPVGEVTRHRSQQQVRVISAFDGALVAEQTVQGAEARACEDEEAWTGWDEDEGEKRIEGDLPDLVEDTTDWLESLINLPDA